MAKRIVTKMGDIFCVEIDNGYKRFFQYIINDIEALNSSVIRVFKTHYPLTFTHIPSISQPINYRNSEYK